MFWRIHVQCHQKSCGSEQWEAGLESCGYYAISCLCTTRLRYYAGNLRREVERLVKDLFGIDIMSGMGIRHLLLGKGVTDINTSNPEITLKVLLPVHHWPLRKPTVEYSVLLEILSVPQEHSLRGLAHVRGVMFLDEVTCHQDVLLRIVQNVACALKRC
jgi:hypothetical protein